MKTKIKRHSRSALSILLTVCMLVSCMTVGLIATDAAKVTDSGTVGVKAYSEVGATSDDSSVGIDESTKRVYVNSSKTYIHYYNDNNMSTEWPGKGLTGLSENYKYADIDTSTTKAILNNNAGSQNQADPPGNWASNSQNYIIHSGSTWETISDYFGTWTVAGNPTSLFGTSWDPANTSNDMTFSDTENAFIKTYSGVTLEAGTVEYKVVKNHSWDNGSKPSNNNTYTISEAGTYDVTIKYDPFTNTVSHTFNKQSSPGDYTITVNSASNGTVTASPTSADENDTVTLNVTPDSGYVLSSLSVKDASNNDVAVDHNDYTFKMPASNVTVTPTFAARGATTLYIAKHDNVKNIHVWDSDNGTQISLAAWPGDSIDRNSSNIYEFGGVDYYKYTFTAANTDKFKFIVSNNGDDCKTTDTGPFDTGYTYYVIWSGAKNNDVAFVDKTNPATYTYRYKVSGADDSTIQTVNFSHNMATINNLTAGTYQFMIVRNINGSDMRWYNNQTISRSDDNKRRDITHVDNTMCTLNADVTGTYTCYLDSLQNVSVSASIKFPVGYRAVGNATFFGTAWDTASSNYEYMLTEMASAYTYNGKEYTYSCSKTMNSSVGTFEFKVWDTNDVWHPDGAGTDISVTNGVKRGQTITFYYNPDTGNVAYEITGTADPEAWPPTEIQNKMDDSSNPLVQIDRTAYPDQYTDTLIYKIATGSNAIESSPSTFSPLYQKARPGTEGAWWADFTSVLPSVGTDQLYFNITSNGSYTGFYSTDNMTFNTDEAPGITVKKTDKDGYKFVEVSGVDSRVTNLGVYITKDNSSNFTYKFFTIKGSTSASKTVKIYAKDGAIRRNGTARDPKSNMDYSTFEKYANTFIYSDSGYTTRFTDTVRSSTHGATGNDELTDTGVFDRYTYDYVPSVEKGTTIYIKTVLKDDTYMNNYYLVGYSINGTVYQLHTVAESQNGTVTETFTIPEDWDYNYVEITPIYFVRSGDTIKFFVEGYDQNVMDAGWGNTVGVYPYYQNPADNDQVANVNNPFGGYPGQPLVFYKGNYYTELPKTYTTKTENSENDVNCTIKGVTLSNMYWDDVHLYTGEVSLHYQTYDFDDLYKIYTEYKDGTGDNELDRIVCAFKYRNRKNNDEPANMTGWTSTNYENYTNGWELLKNYRGEAIDLFGNVLNPQPASNIAVTDSVVHVISQDYKSNCAGDYATEYAVYNTAGTKVVESGGKTTIVPSALAIKTSGDFSKYDAKTRAFQGIYDALKNDSNVAGKPVFITYEKSIFGGGDKADRCDARWFYSMKNVRANAKTRIEYSDDLGENWYTDTFTENTATGSHTGSTAYFTGLSTTASDTPTASADSTTTTDTSGWTGNLIPKIGNGYYVFNATAGSNYKFVGWYILRENYQLNAAASSYASGTTSFTSHAEIAKDGDIFVARFIKVTSGSFTINHRVHKDSTGFGDVYVQAVVKNSSGTTLATYGATTGENATNTVTIPSDSGCIANNSNNVIEATFKPEPYGTSNFVNFYATVSDLLQGYNEVDYIKSIVINMPGVEGYDNSQGIYAKVTYDVNRMFSSSGDSPTQIVSSVTHYSKFALKTNIAYSLEYTFTTRYYGDKKYTYSGTYTEAELRSYFYDQITTKAKENIELDNQFVQSKAPFESNYRQDLIWVVDQVTFNQEHTEGYLTAHQEDLNWSTATVHDFTNAGVLETHKMAAPYMKLFNKTIESKPSISGDETEYINSWTVADGDLYTPLRSTYRDTDDTDKPLYIDHWDLYQLDSFTYNKDGEGNPVMLEDGINLSVDTAKSVLVAKTYSASFNYVGFEDYAVVPVYSKTPVNRQGVSDTLTDASATLLTITRNHWNANTEGNTKGGNYIDGADRIYVDFMLNYNYTPTVNGKRQSIQLSTTGNNIIVGFVIKSYTMVDGQKQYRDKEQVVRVDKSKIDNKNRLEYCYGFNNSKNNSQWGLMFEFTPFIVDTDSQDTSEGAEVKIGNTTYSALYAVNDSDILRGVNFYMIGKPDTDWN